jgi:DNA repair exonuclease SbcCD ATPase subunit
MTQINLNWITGKGFLTFYEPFEFQISEYAGKTLQIDGWNKNDRSKSNGSGKSSLLETIGWGWYGELCRKSRYKDDVIYNSNGVKAKEADIITQFKKDGATYRTERSIEWKKTPELYISCNGEEMLKSSTYVEKQAHLEKILGMNFTSFQCCEMFGDDFMNFPEMKPADRAKTLTDIRGLEKYVLASKRCGENIRDLSAGMEIKDDELKSIEGRITQLRETDYKVEIRKFEEDRNNKITNLEREITATEVELQDLKRIQGIKTEELENKVKQYEKGIEGKNKEIKKFEKFENTYKELLKEQARLDSNKNVMAVKVNDLQKELRDIKAVGEGICSRCKQPVTGEHLKMEVTLINKKIEEEKGRLKQALELLVHADVTLAETEKEISKVNNLKKEVQVAQNQIHETKTAILRLEKDQKTEALKTALTGLKVSLQGQKSAKNPYEKQEEERKKAVFAMAGRAKGLKQEIEGINTDISYQQFWLEGFKKIRMSLFSTMIDNFQSYAQDQLSQYSSEHQIQFSTERETRSGTMKDEFHIIITDGGGTTRAYEMCSGGERQKIKLSIARGLEAMIKDDCGRDFNFMAFDEPNHALDDIGKDINFDLFTKLAEEGKAVLVTDHDALFKDKFDHSITVVKENDKSYIQEGI